MKVFFFLRSISMKDVILTTVVILTIFFGTITLQSQELSVLIEENVYPFPSTNDGAGATWCYGSTPLVRVGDDIFITELAVLSATRPLNNCQWNLLKRNTGGWETFFSDNGNRKPFVMQ